jgi:hypothetical protein
MVLVGLATMSVGCQSVQADQAGAGRPQLGHTQLLDDADGVVDGQSLAYGDAGASDPEARSAVRFGLAVPGSDPAALAAIEQRAGARVGVVRVFARWDTDFPSSSHQALLDEGRRIHLSVRPRTDAGTVIPWADIAAAQPGSPVHDRLQEWTTAIAGYGSQIYFTLNHEPETATSAPNGTAEEYVAAWRTMVAMLRQVGGDEIQTVLVLGRGAYADGTIDDWYPGDDTVDIVGVDPYNWYDCQETDRPWTEPRILLLPAVEFAADRGKPLAIPEIASTEDPHQPARKAEWIRALGTLMADDDLGVPIEFVAWFSVTDRNWPDCQWPDDSSPISAAAIDDLITWFAQS